MLQAPALCYRARNYYIVLFLLTCNGLRMPFQHNEQRRCSPPSCFGARQYKQQKKVVQHEYRPCLQPDRQQAISLVFMFQHKHVIYT
uniref:Uncharacterized protein n=1 Tax=Arundo donax TaxID=35708 RepID=A0A0A8XNH8_ARUDO